MKCINLPLWGAHRLISPKPGLPRLSTRVRSSSTVFRCLSMTFTRDNSTAPTKDLIYLIVQGQVLATKALVGGPPDIQRIQVVLNTPLGLGTGTETIDNPIDNRVLSQFFDAASLVNIKSALNLGSLGHALNDRILTSSRNVRGCTVHIRSLPALLTTKNSRFGLRKKSLSVGKRTVMKAELENTLGTVTQQLDLSDTEWSMSLVLGLLSQGFTRETSTNLGIRLQREYQGTTVSCPTQNSIQPELNALSPQTPGSATISDHAALDFNLHEQLARLAQTTRFPTAEALGSHLADKAYAIADAKYPNNSITHVGIKITRKPDIEGVSTGAIVIVRERSDLSRRPDGRIARLRAQGKHRAIVALGANIGDRISNIEEACRVMDSHGLRVVQTSLLYETEAMYVVNQDPFINGACEVSESPIDKSKLINILCLCLRRFKGEIMRSSIV